MDFKKKLQNLIEIYELDKEKGNLGEYAIGRLNGFKTCLNIFNQTESIKTIVVDEYSCCGRCNGVNDFCVSDQVCKIHNEVGCKTCFSKRTI